MKKIVLVLGLLSLAVSVQAVDKGPDVVVFPGKGKLGSVTFDHLAHHEMGTDCLLCHHSGVVEGKCADCHGKNPAAPHLQDAFHLLCKGCHKHKKATTECEGCHVK